MAYSGIVRGARASGNIYDANKMPDKDRMLYLLEPHRTPVLQYLYFTKGRSEKVINADGRFSWFEDELFPLSANLTGSGIPGGSPTATNIGVDHPEIFNVNDKFIVETTEQMIYVTNADGTTVDVATMDGSNLTAATTGRLIRTGARIHEFDVARLAMSTNEIEQYNYCAIYSETVTTTGRQQAGALYTDGKTHAEEVAKRTLGLKLQIENDFLFSTARGSSLVSGSYRITYGEGFLNRISTNKIRYTTFSEDVFDAFLQQVFEKGSAKRILYAGSNLLTAVNKVLKDRYSIIEQPKNVYGSNLKTWITPNGGELSVMWDPLLGGKFSDYGFAVDPVAFKLRYMDNDKKGSRKFRVEEGVETPGTDGLSSKILFDVGIQIMNEERHGILYKA